jgi:hypothetical protein
MNYSVTVRLEGLEELASLLDTITTTALGPNPENNVHLAQSGVQGALEWLAYKVQSEGMPTQIPLSVFTLELKKHDKYQYDKGRLWNEQEIEASVEGERAVAIAWPRETDTSHRERGKKDFTYRDLIKMWLDVQEAGGKVIISSKANEDAWRSAIAWLRRQTGIKPNAELRKGPEKGIYLPGRKVIPDEVKEETAEIVARVIAELVARRIARTLQESFA